jgi:hypothetical protein
MIGRERKTGSWQLLFSSLKLMLRLKLLVSPACAAAGVPFNKKGMQFLKSIVGKESTLTPRMGRDGLGQMAPLATGGRKN